MSSHTTAELLSAYLDDELDEGRVQQVDAHLSGCADCRARFTSMRRVVTTLHRLEREAPPPILAHEVARRVALDGQPRSLAERMESRFPTLRQPSSLFFLFSLVFALAVILYLFAHGVDRAGRRTAVVVTQLPAVTGEVQETRQIADRPFDLIDGVWRQRGVDQPVADVVVSPDSPEGQQLLALFPQLATLPGGRIILAVEGSVVELRGLNAGLPAPAGRQEAGEAPPPDR